MVALKGVSAKFTADTSSDTVSDSLIVAFSCTSVPESESNAGCANAGTDASNTMAAAAISRETCFMVLTVD